MKTKPEFQDCSDQSKLLATKPKPSRFWGWVAWVIFIVVLSWMAISLLNRFLPHWL